MLECLPVFPTSVGPCTGMPTLNKLTRTKHILSLLACQHNQMYTVIVSGAYKSGATFDKNYVLNITILELGKLWRKISWIHKIILNCCWIHQWLFAPIQSNYVYQNSVLKNISCPLEKKKCGTPKIYSKIVEDIF